MSLFLTSNIIGQVILNPTNKKIQLILDKYLKNNNLKVRLFQNLLALKIIKTPFLFLLRLL
jgi:hypothetical protein